MAQRSHKLGIDANQPIDYQGRVAPRLEDPQIIASTGAAWVRLNFVLGPAPGPENREWRETFETLVDQYLAEGLNIYGLIGHESVRSGVGDLFRVERAASGSRSQADRWIAEYVDNFAEIVTQFYPRIKLFESFNEPDDWRGQQNNWIHPSWFGVMLDEIYQRIKVELGLTDVTLISGPLQGLEINNNAPTDYLTQTYQYGREALGWGGPNRPYPFDGVGYHIYIKEQQATDWNAYARQYRQLYDRYVEDIERVIRRFEGADKPLYISEIGWPSNNDDQAAKNFQADVVKLVLDLLNNDDRVTVGIWFCTEDFISPPHKKFYGLYEQNKPTPQGRKPAYQAYKEFCEALLAEGSGGLDGDVIAPSTGPLSPLPSPISAELRVWLTDLRERMLELERQMAILQAQMSEIVASQASVDDLLAEIDLIKEQVKRLAEGGGVTPIFGPPKPPIEDLTATIPRHPTQQFERRPIEQIRWIIIQHTGNNPAIGARRIAEYLVGKGRPGLTYHYFINDQALIQQINPLTAETSHPQVVMVGFAGDFTDVAPPSAQIEAGADLIAWLLSELDLSLEAVKGAKEVSNTRSPGDQWDSGQRWGATLRSEIEERL